MSQGYKRSVYAVKKSLQYRFIAWVVGTVVVAVLVVLLDVFISLQRQTEGTGLAVRVWDLYNPADPMTLIKLFIYAGGVCLATLFLSHRVAGPIYRFERSAEEVSRGDLTHKVFLRQQDELLEFRDAFNVMVDALRTKVAGDVACVFRARKHLETLLESGGLPEALTEKVKRAMRDLEQVGKGFKI